MGVPSSNQWTPSLSIRGNVRVSSDLCGRRQWLSGIRPGTERSSEPERTLILAILATHFFDLFGAERGPLT
jgi:hypothetical protein